MPTYEYKCSKCNYEFEKFHGINDTPALQCPECNGVVERLISGGAGILLNQHSNKHEPCCSRGEMCDNPRKCCGQ